MGYAAKVEIYETNGGISKLISGGGREFKRKSQSNQSNNRKHPGLGQWHTGEENRVLSGKGTEIKAKRESLR